GPRSGGSCRERPGKIAVACSRMPDAPDQACVDLGRTLLRLKRRRVPAVRRATGPRARAAYWRYTAALDAEEWAAEVYASLVRRVGYPATRDGDLSGPLAA
ncbi:MAG TPA: hypothetical protein VGI55_04780, partial [Solirubrobacteraceae bacterium]